MFSLSRRGRVAGTPVHVDNVSTPLDAEVETARLVEALTRFDSVAAPGVRASSRSVVADQSGDQPADQSGDQPADEPARPAAERPVQLTPAPADADDELLRGAAQALIDVMAFAKPQAFGRAQRISGVVRELAAASGIEGRWDVEVAGALAQLATLSLPGTVLDKLDRGAPLSSDERLTMSRVPAMSAKLLAAIPGTEELCRAISVSGSPVAGQRAGAPEAEEPLSLLPHLIRVAVDFDQLLRGRIPVATVIEQLRRRATYRVDVLDTLERVYLSDLCDETAPREVSVEELEPGMVLADEVTSTDGVLLVRGGVTVTHAMIRRLSNYTEHGECAGRVLVLAQLERV